jgi:NAD(P)-dependent dehydrogenase (short-subunit alcohol dehydrogenase family)
MPVVFPDLTPWTYPVMNAADHRTAIEVITENGADWSLKGKVCLITGVSSGIGAETVRAIASRGGRVFVLVRQVDKTRAVLDKVAAEFPAHGGMDIIQCELDSLESVNAAANEFIKRSSNQLNILINNAGMMKCPFALTKDGYESQLAVNHLAHFLLLKKVLPLLLASSSPDFQSRVVSVASAGHLWGSIDYTDINFTHGREYTGFGAYSQSKLANVWLAVEAERLYGSRGVHSWSLHPGGVQTELFRHTIEDKQGLIDQGVFDEQGNYQFNILFKSVEQGAATSVWAATSPELEGKGGLYLEDIRISEPSSGTMTGHASCAYDTDGAAKLWEWSEQAVSKFMHD